MAAKKLILLVLSPILIISCASYNVTGEGGCPKSMKQFGNICYFVNSKPLAWLSGNEFCKNKGGQLASVTGGALNRFLAKTFRSASVWIGLTKCRRTWCYPDRKPSLYYNWNRNQPNNARRDEYCVEMFKNGRFSDQSCYFARPSICEMLDADECLLGTHKCHSQATCKNIIASYTCTCNRGFTGNGSVCKDKDECVLEKNNCHFEATCNNTIGSYTCTCNEGFTGNGTICYDKNECALGNHRCHFEASCNNTIGSYTCTCTEGFTGNGRICKALDEDECALNTHRCHSHATCNNTIGSYTCTCKEGFSGNGNVCKENDECSLETHRCHPQASCNNTFGSFTCTCNKGFIGNGTICEDRDECALGNHRCHSQASCSNTIGSYTCACNNGFGGNGTLCKEEDKCALNTHRCHPQATCNNTIGSYTCTCNEGFSGNGTICKDNDECTLETHRCHFLASCNNTFGSYTCTCNEGFLGNGNVCKDNDECTLESYRCHEQASCNNTIGSYSCICNKGFTGNGAICEDKDECALKTDRCHSKATCNNFFGSYICTCNEGFSGNGNVCKDNDECTLETHRCNLHASCNNTIGSYTCTCNEGFIGNGTICEDEDECALNTHRCHSQATCSNVPGSYSCTCNEGFTGNGKICEDLVPTKKNFRKKDRLRKLKERVNGLYKKNSTARKKCARNILQELFNLTYLDTGNRKQEMLSPENLHWTVEIIQKIVYLNISDSSFNILGPVNNILDDRSKESWRNMTDWKLIRNLAITLQNYGFQYGEKLKNNKSASPIFHNHSNVQMRVKYQKRLESAPQDRIFKFPNTSFILSPDALPNNSGAVVVVVWYKTLNLLLTNNDYDGNNHTINSRIITASVRPEPNMSFEEPVRIIWNGEKLDKPKRCVYWKPELNENLWKSDGCKRGNFYSDSLICECDHLTAFANMDISGRSMLSKAEQGVLERISTVGCSLSLAGVILTILAHVLQWKRIHRHTRSKVPSKVLINLCVSIGMTNVLAILAGPARDQELFCITVSILLYFSVLALFGWMLCEGIIIYLQLVNVYASLNLGGKYMKAFNAIGWGFPLVIVVLLVAVNNPVDFITEHSCWCGVGGVLFLIFVGTIGLILLINIAIFFLALRKALSSSEVSTIRYEADTVLRKAKIGLKGSAVLLPILGLTWVFGLLVFNRDTVLFKYLFAIFNSLQGMMIFASRVLLNTKFHEAFFQERKIRNERRNTHVMIKNNTCSSILPTNSECSNRKFSVLFPPEFVRGTFDRSPIILKKKCTAGRIIP